MLDFATAWVEKIFGTRKNFLVISIFSYSKSVSKGLLLQGYQNYGFCGNGLTLFTSLTLFKSFENTAGKGEIALYEQFLLFPQCFLPV